MKEMKRGEIRRIINDYIIDYKARANLSYNWNYGAILGISLVIQIITGIMLGFHYQNELAFISVEHIMREVNNGWIIRYTHSNGASIFFILVYLHIGRALYYGSYKRKGLYVSGIIIFLIMMGTAFIGYTLPGGQMSLWGATVITNLLSAIRYIGKELTEYIWGGYSVTKITINRFYSIHYLLRFILTGLIIIHIILLHSKGSTNRIGINGGIDKIPFNPYYTKKDLWTIILVLLLYIYLIMYKPNILGHSDNYIEGNALVTRKSIVPEWYFLPFYAILRAIPNKLLGVIGMVLAILINISLIWSDKSEIRAIRWKPLSKILYWLFIMNILLLTWLGSQHAEEPYITLSRISTIIYFSYYILIGIISRIENKLYGLGEK